ncbi:UNVERIFIED_CONTAM: hypothetical protein Sradi_5395800 [Sesamum radiatum]|uniref:Uncharacterized protein n=1 Tax=Sesamum radiatum TaxID=300843 RepID=A0AAW2LRN1_SESRA
MSEEFREFYYHQPFHDDQRRVTGGATNFPYSGTAHSSAYDSSSSLHPQYLQMFDPSYLSFTEFLHGSADHNSFSTAFGSTSEAFSALKEEEKPVVGGGETPATPNSSISSASTEAAAGDQEDSNKGKKESQVKETAEDGEDNSKGKAKKKGEKKERQPRFAFMTKSEKLLQVHHSKVPGEETRGEIIPRPFGCDHHIRRATQPPRSGDSPWERGRDVRLFHAISAPSLTLDGHSFPQELLAQMPHLYSYVDGGSSSNLYHPQQQFQQFPVDYGLLQDIIPPGFPKQEP